MDRRETTFSTRAGHLPVFLNFLSPMDWEHLSAKLMAVVPVASELAA